MTVDEVKRLRQRDAQFKAHYDASRDKSSAPTQQEAHQSALSEESSEQNRPNKQSFVDKIKRWFNA